MTPAVPPVHTATYTFRYGSVADADAVFGSLQVERADKIPNVDAEVRWAEGQDKELEVVLRSPDVGDLRAATKSFWTRIRAASDVLEASARDEK